MPLVVTVTLFRPAFHGLGASGEAQWPPSPIRLLGALKNGAHLLRAEERSAHEALDRLAAGPAPVIHAPRAVDLKMPDTYTDRTWLPDRLSATSGEKPSQYLGLDHFGMDSQNRAAKPQGALALAGRTLEFHVELELDGGLVEVLDSAAGYVPYFGRSNDPASVTVRKVDAEHRPPKHSESWYPNLSRGTPTLGWQRNTIAWMDENYERRTSMDPVINVLPPLPPEAYTRPLRYSRTASAATRFETYPFPASLAQRRTPDVLRAVVDQLPDGWRALPLTSSGHPRADGRLVGIGLLASIDEMSAVPRGEVRKVVQALIDPDAPQTSAMHARDPDTWVRSSRRWSSSTPLRGFPDARVLSYVLGEEARRMHGTGVTITDARMHPRLRRQHSWPDRAFADGLAQWWVDVVFDDEVAGPVQLGAATEEGFGMFIPAERRS